MRVTTTRMDGISAAGCICCATCTGAYNHDYVYNAIGNIVSFPGGPYTYGSAKPHAATAAFGNTYGYVANGNRTSWTIGGGDV